MKGNDCDFVVDLFCLSVCLFVLVLYAETVSWTEWILYALQREL